jgi:hypothetical protein
LGPNRDGASAARSAWMRRQMLGLRGTPKYIGFVAPRPAR